LWHHATIGIVIHEPEGDSPAAGAFVTVTILAHLQRPYRLGRGTRGARPIRGTPDTLGDPAEGLVPTVRPHGRPLLVVGALAGNLRASLALPAVDRANVQAEQL
jgi:hypothetical protein